MMKLLLHMGIPLLCLFLAGCSDPKELSPVRITFDPPDSITSGARTYTAKEFSTFLQGRKRYISDFYPVILVGGDELTGNDLTLLISAISHGFLIDLWFETRRDGKPVLAKGAIPLPDARINDMEMLLDPTGARVRFHAEKWSQWVSVSKPTLLFNIGQVAATWEVTVEGKSIVIPPKLGSFPDGIKDLHPKIGIYWTPSVRVGEVIDLLLYCQSKGLANLVPIQLAYCGEEPLVMDTQAVEEEGRNITVDVGARQ